MARRALALLTFAALAASPAARAGEALRNWFGDPFFRASAALPHCPLPAGPFVDAAERRVQSHRRAEKGTTCWLAKECDRPNAFAYDRDIAAAFVKGQRSAPGLFAHTSLWVTVQGRVVYIEGCVQQDAQAAAIEAFARGLPHVQQALAIVRTEGSASVPYRLRHGH